MKIKEFAKACGVTESTIRFYDKNGLLKPAEINLLTGYRYYDEGQIAAVKEILSLKSAGFALSEIRKIISENADPLEIKDIFSEKEKELNQSLCLLGEVYKSITGGDFMNKKPTEILHENVNLPFENDEKIIGRWEIVGEPAVNMGSCKRELYFLPNGEWYWCYGWTKGKFLYNDGCSSRVCDYTLDNSGDDLYMTINFKTCGGTIDPIHLKKLDSNRYTSSNLARKDNIDLPFENDPQILGKWKAVDFIKSKKDFSTKPGHSGQEFYFSQIEFLPGGECGSVYGDETISGSDRQTWTKGCVLRKWNSTACGYEIISSDNRKFLIMEWKSGDYRWGGFDTDYYVFEKAD
ncbi:MAG: MerR family transcriptional regulator [Oscillospiraceae bacterium]|nr:MerR family transcriptional regulator [Oscillospiraceae bacterium]